MAEPNTNPQTAPTEPNAQNAQNTPQFDYEKLASLITGKQSVTEDTVLKSYFKQQGLSEDEMKQAIGSFKEQKAKNTPDISKLQSDITAANTARLKAEINQSATVEAIKQGVDVNSIPYVLKMASFDGVTDNDGKIAPDKLSEAIKKVLDDVPALKASAEPIKTAVLGTNGGAGSNPLESIRRAMGLPTEKK